MSNQRTQAGGGGFAFLVFLAVLIVTGWTLFWAGQALAGPGVSYNPLDLLRAALEPDRQIVISTGGVIVSVVLFILLLVVATVIAGIRTKRRNTRKGANVIDSTRHLATGHQIERMSRKQVAKTTARTNPDLPDHAAPGFLLGRELRTGKEVWVDYETLMADMWAARYGKTTGRVLPMMLQAPGGVVTTGNKPDLVADSIAARSTVGETWVCDPQRIYKTPDEAPGFYIDMLDYIRRRPQDEWDAAGGDLAVLFANNAGVDVGSGGNDEQWRTSGAEILSCFLLAATLAGRQVTDILEWVYDESNREPLEILQQYGFPSMALQAKGTYDLTEKTRSGVFFSVRNMVAPLSKKILQRWVTPQPGAAKFDPEQFIADHEADRCPTLYLLSDSRSAGSASLLSLLMVVWVTEAAEDASRRNGGRLRIPLALPLDEVANCVKWGNLPEVYSHFGSKGIILASVFQGFRQPRRLFGADNAHDMITNSCLLIGGGIKDEEFLKEAVALIGEYDRQQVSHSANSGSWQTSTQVSDRERAILTVADLRALDPSLMVVIPQKNAPMIVEATPFWKRTLRPEMNGASGDLAAAQRAAESLGQSELAGEAAA